VNTGTYLSFYNKEIINRWTFVFSRVGDCYGESSSIYCLEPNLNCTIYAPSAIRISKCENQLANYLHVQHRCVPINSNIIKNNNICDQQSGDITDLKGFISSPNYPIYTTQTTECLRKIQVPNDKVINIWLINDIKAAGAGQE
jgi:hypothetical protein